MPQRVHFNVCVLNIQMPIMLIYIHSTSLMKNEFVLCCIQIQALKFNMFFVSVILTITFCALFQIH